MGRIRISTRRLLGVAMALGLVPTLVVPPAAAVAADTAAFELLAKAVADECFNGVGQPYPAGPPCAEGLPKINQAYVWGLAQSGHNLWFGTGANVLCLKPEGYQVREPIVNDDYVCEYNQSEEARQHPELPPALGDMRTPEVYVYDLAHHRLTEKTDQILLASAADANLLETTAGLRAGGYFNGVVLLAGPSAVDGVNIFAFDAGNGRYLGSANLLEYQNVRHFAVAEGALYVGVGVGKNGGESGFVLRWTGNKANPFRFIKVANLPTQATDITVHKGRIFVTTWPQAVVEGAAGPAAAEPSAVTAADLADTSGLASVWMSPKLSDGAPGLVETDAESWTQIWNAGQYEPDPVVARAYALGGIASYGGYLYWGTMHVPTQATALHLATYPPKTQQQALLTIANTQRAFSVFRASAVGEADQQVQALYGESQLPAYNPLANNGAGAWSVQPTGYTPVDGASGFGNPFNLYAWTMAVGGGKLYIGTMDWSYLSLVPDTSLAALGTTDEVRAALADPSAAPLPLPDPSLYGGDLWAFDSTDTPAIGIDTTGQGNYLNQGVRNLIADDKALYLGIANPMNMRADPTDDVPEGGWELLRLPFTHCS